MDGKGRYADNILIERLWRTVKYEEVYLKAYSNGREARAGLDAYFSFYNNQRPHQALGYRTPAEVFNADRGHLMNGQSMGNGHRAEYWQTLEIRRDSHLVLHQTCPTNGVHLTRQRRAGYFRSRKDHGPVFPVVAASIARLIIVEAIESGRV